MIHKHLSALLCTVALVFSTQTVTAQVTPIPGSGCPTMPGISVTGNARIATTIQCSCPPSIDRMRVMIGLPATRFFFNKPFMCLDRCALDMTLLVLLPTPGWTVAIPNDPTLIGQSLVVQCLQSSLNRPCLLLTGAAEIKVQL